MRTDAQSAINPMTAIAASLTPKKAVSYLRVSTARQARRGGGDIEGFSLPAQREANRNKAASLGSIVVKEFKDGGESGTSTKRRGGLKDLLDYLDTHEVDYVIVHKLDRLARNRYDDSDITRLLSERNVRLISTTEPIDETPAGMLLHGILASMNDFYSHNLRIEVLKGLTQKARGGGTIGRAPLGYRNRQTTDDEGRERRDVVIDPERGPLIRKAFEMFATGEWTVAELVSNLNAQGLTTVRTPHMPSRPVTEGHLNKVLTNPYYTGIVSFQGASYPGRHDALIDRETWLQVQTILASHVNGERTRRHPHYLRSTLYCGNCGERMLVQVSTSKTGQKYPYFTCAGRHSGRTTCQQKSVLIDHVEDKVVELYRERVRLSAEHRDAVEKLMKAELQAAIDDATGNRDSLKREADKLERQRQKLLEAHYADAIPVELLKQEQARITSALERIQKEQLTGTVHFTSIQGKLEKALDLLASCADAYAAAPDHIRRLFNQVFFEKVLVVEDDDAEGGSRLEAQLHAPFDTLTSPEMRHAVAAPRQKTANEKPTENGGLRSSTHVQRSGLKQVPAFTLVRGFSKRLLVDLRVSEFRT